MLYIARIFQIQYVCTTMIYVGDAAQFYFEKKNEVKFNSIWDRQDHSYPTFPVLQHGVLYCPQGSSTKPENGHCLQVYRSKSSCSSPTLLSGESTKVHLLYWTPRYLNGKMQGLLAEAPLKYKAMERSRKHPLNMVTYLVVIQVSSLPWLPESRFEI